MGRKWMKEGRLSEGTYRIGMAGLRGKRRLCLFTFRRAGFGLAGLCYCIRGVVFASWLGRGNLLWRNCLFTAWTGSRTESRLFDDSETSQLGDTAKHNRRTPHHKRDASPLMNWFLVVVERTRVVDWSMEYERLYIYVILVQATGIGNRNR